MWSDRRLAGGRAVERTGERRVATCPPEDVRTVASAGASDADDAHLRWARALGGVFLKRTVGRRPRGRRRQHKLLGRPHVSRFRRRPRRGRRRVVRRRDAPRGRARRSAPRHAQESANQRPALPRRLGRLPSRHFGSRARRRRREVAEARVVIRSSARRRTARSRPRAGAARRHRLVQEPRRVGRLGRLLLARALGVVCAVVGGAGAARVDL
mmetsp:Transcript_27159/g.91285  ORF Transcript_27159/g.91285 Transcript_27159/m.91285 type:complete len:212 (+) Transcript_27159:61-696(+)